MSESWDRDVFERLFSADPDPWQFHSSPYEAEKYAASLQALGDARFHKALEIGCANGAMTRPLAARCEELLAVDLAPTAIALARRFCDGLPHVSFQNAAMPRDLDVLPSGPFDLLVISELLYFLCAPDIERLAIGLLPRLSKSATILIVNWTGHTDTPCTGDEAATLFVKTIQTSGLFTYATTIKPSYRIDLLIRKNTPQHD